MGKYSKLGLLRLVVETHLPWLEQFASGYTGTEEKGCARVCLNWQYSFNALSFTAWFRTELGTYSCAFCISFPNFQQ